MNRRGDHQRGPFDRGWMTFAVRTFYRNTRVESGLNAVSVPDVCVAELVRAQRVCETFRPGDFSDLLTLWISGVPSRDCVSRVFSP